MKTHFIFIFTVFTSNLGFGQINPVQNLIWSHYYDYTNYRNIYSLSWQSPETPHHQLIGYHIYRDSQLYKFQTTNSVGCNPDWGVTSGCDFLTQAFTVYVKAVYEGNVESEAVSYTLNGPALSTKEFLSKSFAISPNPSKEIIHFSEEISHMTISDFYKKIIKQIPNAEKSINVSKLEKGTYIISGKTKTGETISKKFIKE